MKRLFTIFAFIAMCSLVAQTLPEGPVKFTLGNGAVLELLPCKPGTFTMGSPNTELGRFPDEVQREIKIDKTFWLGKTEITQQQWDALMTAPDRQNEAWFHAPSLPMENISWFDAQEFCRRLTESEKKAKHIPENAVFRLPTEAEWEYACRAGTTTAFNNGKEYLQKNPAACPELAEIAVFRFNSGGRKGRFNKTKPVATRKPNAWGFFDMQGNVQEWCQDDYTVTAPPGQNKLQKNKKQQAPVVGNASAAVNTGDGPIAKIYRGGSFLSIPSYCRAAYRGSTAPETRSNCLGLRVVLAIQ